MREVSPSELRELATDIELELARLGRLENAIVQVRQEIDRYPTLSGIFYESLALKLHNFYTGCERIFQLIVSELNGALPSSFDWHKRLLNRMSVEREGLPPVLSSETVLSLREYLGFRHIVRNIYGFELETERVEDLVQGYSQVWHCFESEVRRFVQGLRELAERLEEC